MGNYAYKGFYDPNTMRFQAVDPVKGNVMNPQSMNQYLYALNNPLRFVDVLGLAPGDLQVNGHNIGYTTEINGKMYGSLSDFANAIGADIVQKGSMYILDFGNRNAISFGAKQIAQVSELKWNILGIRGHKITQKYFYIIECKDDEILFDLQELINLAGDKVISLSYDLGDKGGTFIKSSLFKTIILPIDKGVDFYKAKYKNFSLDFILSPEVNAPFSSKLSNDFADLLLFAGANEYAIYDTIQFAGESKVIIDALDENHQFINVEQAGTGAMVYTLINASIFGNYYEIRDKNIGVFKYGEYKQ